jgi:hypothetical protein
MRANGSERPEAPSFSTAAYSTLAPKDRQPQRCSTVGLRTATCDNICAQCRQLDKPNLFAASPSHRRIALSLSPNPPPVVRMRTVATVSLQTPLSWTTRLVLDTLSDEDHAKMGPLGCALQ